MDGHTNKLGHISDPAVRQESEQLHADAITALRHSKAFMLVTLDQDDTARVRSTFNHQVDVKATMRFAKGCLQAANTVYGRCLEIITDALRRAEEDAA